MKVVFDERPIPIIQINLGTIVASQMAPAILDTVSFNINTR
ncbi:hypothetical protein ACV56Z_04040 [Staphylococcus aureus]